MKNRWNIWIGAFIALAPCLIGYKASAMSGMKISGEAGNNPTIGTHGIENINPMLNSGMQMNDGAGFNISNTNENIPGGTDDLDIKKDESAIPQIQPEGSKEANQVEKEVNNISEEIQPALQAASNEKSSSEDLNKAGEQTIAPLTGETGSANSGGPVVVPNNSAPTPPEDRLKALNAAVVEVLKPFNNVTTKAVVKFSKLETNDKRAVAVKAKVQYEKTGPTGITVKFDVKDASYSFPEAPGSIPQFSVKAKMAFDLVRVYTQAVLNKAAGEANEYLAQAKLSFLQYYGGDQKIETKATATPAKGDVERVDILLDFKVDLTKLPTSLDAKDVPVTSGRLTAAVTRHDMGLSAQGIMNPGARWFQEDEQGLKEWIDKLLARDPQSLSEIASDIQWMDRTAAELISKQTPPPAADGAAGNQGNTTP